MRLLMLGLLLSGMANAQDVTQLQSDVNSLKQIVAGQQAEISSKKTKVWTKSTAPGATVYYYGSKGLVSELSATFLQPGKWYRVIIEAEVNGSAGAWVFEGDPTYPCAGCTPSNKRLAEAGSAYTWDMGGHVSATGLWQAKSNKLNVYAWSSTGVDGCWEYCTQGWISNSANGKTLTLTIEEVDVLAQPW